MYHQEERVIHVPHHDPADHRFHGFEAAAEEDHRFHGYVQHEMPHDRDVPMGHWESRYHDEPHHEAFHHEVYHTP